MICFTERVKKTIKQVVINGINKVDISKQIMGNYFIKIVTNKNTFETAWLTDSVIDKIKKHKN